MHHGKCPKSALLAVLLAFCSDFFLVSVPPLRVSLLSVSVSFCLSVRNFAHCKAVMEVLLKSCRCTVRLWKMYKNKIVMGKFLWKKTISLMTWCACVCVSACRKKEPRPPPVWNEHAWALLDKKKTLSV